MHYGLIF